MQTIAIVLVVFALNLTAWPAVTATDSTVTDTAATDVRLRTFLEKDTVPLNKEVVYHVELSWQGTLQRYRILKAGEPVLTNLKLRGSGSSNRFFTDKQGRPHSLKTITYYFTPQGMGMAYIDGVIIQYADAKSGDKESLISQRLGVKIIEAVAGRESRLNAGQLVVFILLALFILLLGYFLYRYSVMRKRAKEEAREVPPTLEELYRQRLKEEVKNGAQRATGRFGVLSKLLRNYLREKFDLPAVSTFSEIENHIPAETVGADLHNKLKALYDRSELSKFAGEEISDTEFQLFYDTVELLLERMTSGSEEG